MAFFLIRLLDSGMRLEPLLPVVTVAAAAAVPAKPVPLGAKAVADKMPPTAEDYVWTYTETGEASLRPVVVAVAVGTGR